MWKIIAPGKPEFIFCGGDGFTLGQVEEWADDEATIIYVAKPKTRTAAKAIARQKEKTFNPDEYM